MNKKDLIDSFSKTVKKHLKDSSSAKSFDDLIEVLGNMFAYNTAQSMVEDDLKVSEAKQEARDIGKAIGALIASDFERIQRKTKGS